MTTSIYATNRSQLLPPLGYLQADCGTGKSYQTIKQVIHHSRFNVQLVVCGKTDLLDQWERDLLAHGANNVIKAHYKTVAGNVNQHVTDTVLNYCYGNNTCEGVAGACPIILITFATLVNLNFTIPDYENPGEYLDINRAVRSQCHLWIDELPNLDEPRRVWAKNNPGEIKQWLKLDRKISDCRTEANGINIADSLHTVVAIDSGLLRHEMMTMGQHYHDKRPLLQSVLSRNETVYIKKSQWDLMNKRVKKKNDEDNGETYFISVLNKGLMSGWGSCTFISADFDRSKFSHWFKSSRFTPHNAIRSKLRNGGYHHPDLLKRVRIVYAMPDDEKRLNSANYLKTYGEALDKKFMREVKKIGQPFLLCTNTKRNEGREILDIEGCKVITSAEHGSNSFSDYNVLVFDCALRPEPKHEGILSTLGFDRGILHTDMVLNALYQTACRTSIRNDSSSETVTIFCMERSSAFDLANRLSGASRGFAYIRHIDEQGYQAVVVGGDSGTSPESPNGHGKSVCKSTTKPIFAPFDVGLERKEKFSLPHTKRCKFRNIPNKSTTCENTVDLPATPDAVGAPCRRAGMTIFPHHNSRNPEFVEASLLKQIRELREAAQQPVTDRISEGYRFTSAIFKRAEGTRAKRDKASFSHAHMLVLDFDGNDQPDHRGSMTARDFVRVFNPSQKRKGTMKLSFAITNTFNTSDKNPFKFRVFVILSEPVTSPEQYRASVELIESHIVKAGFKNSGLDPMSKNAVQIYWMPCTNTRHKKHAFFETYNCSKNREIERHGLTPPKVEAKPAHLPNDRPKVKAGFSVETVKANYLALTDNRRFGLKELGTRCATQGAMYPHEVERVLLSVVDSADCEMMKRVGDTIKQLRNEVRWWK